MCNPSKKMNNSKKNPLKNLNKYFSSTIKKVFSPSKRSEPKSNYFGTKSQHECPCTYHMRQRAKYQLRLASERDENGLQRNVESGEREDTNMLLMSNGNRYESQGEVEKAVQWCNENKLTLDEVYALVKGKSVDRGVDVVEHDDVDERAEEFIRKFREQLRIQRLVSEELISMKSHNSLDC